MGDIIDRYVFLSFLKNFLGAEILLIGICVIVKVMERIEVLLLNASKRPDSYDGILYILLHIPNFMFMITAPAMMFAISFTLAGLSKNNELFPIFTAGRSLQRTVAPALLFAVFMTFSMFIFNEFLAFPSLYKANVLYEKIKIELGFKKRSYRDKDYKNTVFQFKNQFYHIGKYDPLAQKFNNLHLVELNDQGKLVKIIEAEYGHLKGKKWELNNIATVNFTSTGEVHNTFLNKQVIKLISQETIKKTRDKKKFSEKNIFDLFQNIRDRKLLGVNIQTHLTELYWHFFFPMIYIFVVLAGSIIGGLIREGGAPLSIGISTLFTIFYYLVMYFGKSFGSIGVLHPAIAASLANWFFLISTFYLMYRVNTRV